MWQRLWNRMYLSQVVGDHSGNRPCCVVRMCHDHSRVVLCRWEGGYCRLHGVGVVWQRRGSWGYRRHLNREGEFVDLDRGNTRSCFLIHFHYRIRNLYRIRKYKVCNIVASETVVSQTSYNVFKDFFKRFIYPIV